MAIIIKNGIIVRADDTFAADLLIANERIQAIGRNLVYSGAEVIDARDCYVMPGGVDAHTHCNLEIGGARVHDDFFSATRAAAWGGTTCIVEHPGFGPEGCDLDHQIKQYQRAAQGQAVIDYGLHGVFQHVDTGVLDRISGLIHEGIPSFKVYLTYAYALGDEDLSALLPALKKHNGLFMVHAENDAIIQALQKQFLAEGKTGAIWHARSRPDYCEAEAVERVLGLAEAAGGVPVYIVHLSTALGLEKIRQARARGQVVYAETCPQYLLLDESCYEEPDSAGLKYVMSPPLRNTADQEALWQALRGNEIDVVATDHCAFDFSLKKSRGQTDFSRCPGGIAGLETRVPLLFSEGVIKKRLSLERFVDAVATRPAKIMGLYPRKGDLCPGADADVVILDPRKQVFIRHSELHDAVDYTPFEGFKVQGWPILTMVRGQVLVKDNIFMGEKGFGRFLPRAKSV
ncbi:MAG: dihydropyrimidinase [Desulfobacteraceae bacterium]|nr:MAG: dihydropyrimidinase [Desulfobacteraceae bacterium]